MQPQNSNNTKITNLADGFEQAGGTTPRKLTVTGANITLTGSGTAVHTFPATTSTLARTDAAQTFTGVQTMTSPAITTPTGIVKGDVGLGNVDNTTDVGKPVSTAQQTALNLKANLASPTFTGTVVLPNSQALVTPVLGTPTSVTLTNATGLLVSGIVNSTSLALGLGSINLGHATDTSIARS